MTIELLSLIAIFGSSALFLWLRLSLIRRARHSRWLRWPSRAALAVACLLPGTILLGLISLSPRRFLADPANPPLALAMGTWLLMLYMIDRYWREADTGEP